MASPSLSAPLRLGAYTDLLPIVANQAGGIAIGLVSLRLSSEWVPPAAFGVYGLFLALAAVGSTITHAGVARYASRYGMEGRSLGEFLRWLWRQAAFPSAAVLAVPCGIFLWNRGRGTAWGDPVFGAALAMALLGSAASLVFHLILQHGRHYRRDFAVSFAGNALRALLPLGCAYVWGPQPRVLAGGFALAVWLETFGTVCSVSDLAAMPVASTGQPAITSYHLPLALAGGFTWLGSHAHRWLCSLAFDRQELGWAILAGNLAFVLPNVLGAVCWQYVYSRAIVTAAAAPARAWRQVERAILGFAVLALVGGLALFFVLPWLPGTLISQGYAPCLRFVPSLYACGCAVALGQFYQGQLLVLPTPWGATSVTAAATLVLFGGGLVAVTRSADTLLWWLALSPVGVGLVARTVARRLWRRSLAQRSA